MLMKLPVDAVKLVSPGLGELLSFGLQVTWAWLPALGRAQVCGTHLVLGFRLERQQPPKESSEWQISAHMR